MLDRTQLRHLGQIRYRILAIVFLSTLLPIAVLAHLIGQQATSRTLDAAKLELQATTEAYARSIRERLEFSDLSLRFLIDVAPLAVAEWSIDTAAMERSAGDPDAVDVTLLRATATGLAMRLAVNGRYTWIPIDPNIVLYDIDAGQPGVERCVDVDGRPWRCTGSLQSPAKPLTVSARVPLEEAFESLTDVVIRSQMDPVTALDSISSLSRVTPLILLAIYLLTVVLLMRFVTRRLAPLAELQRATRRIEQGDYAVRVTVGSGDELGALGHAFNRMCDRVQASFTTLRSMSEIDRTILTATRPDEVVERALAYCAADGIDAAVVLTGESQSGRVKLWHPRDGRVQHETLAKYHASGAHGRGSLHEFCDWLRGSGVAFDEALPLTDDTGLAGAMLLRGTAPARLLGPNLSAVADRLSLALAHLGRAHDLFRHAHFDPLTGLMNRHALKDRLGLAIAHARRDGSLGALLFVNLDRFQQVNDAQGHGAGDQLLTTIAARIAATLRAGDSLARLGGDEFAVIAPGIQKDADVLNLCERLVERIAGPVLVDGLEHAVGASIGIAIFPRDGTSEEELLTNADAAVHRVKAQGGGSFAFFDNEMNALVRERVRMEARLRRAIAADELEVVFQPIYDLTLQRVTGAEALLRWTDAELGSIEPSRFIPVAEDTGLIRDLTPVLIRRSVQALRMLPAESASGIRVAVNASPKDLLSGNFASRFLEAIAAAGACPHQFTVEITESAFIDDVACVGMQLEELRSCGVRVALDDFGVGYSSLSLLRTLPLDVIKIDRSFVAEITRSDRDRRLAEQIIGIATTFGRMVVAEGVTSQQELELLAAFGCHCVQGYGISPPLPAPAFTSFVLDQHSSVRSLRQIRRR
jgi:diguanylate cyclase (GGDEF)-like protein